MSRTAASANGTTSPTQLIGGRRDDLYASTVTPSATLQSVLPLADDIDTKPYEAKASLQTLKRRITGTSSQLTSDPPGTTPSATLAITENGQTAGERTQNDDAKGGTTQDENSETARPKLIQFPPYDERISTPANSRAAFLVQWEEMQSQSRSIKVE